MKTDLDNVQCWHLVGVIIISFCHLKLNWYKQQIHTLKQKFPTAYVHVCGRYRNIDVEI